MTTPNPITELHNLQRAHHELRTRLLYLLGYHGETDAGAVPVAELRAALDLSSAGPREGSAWL